MQQSQNNENPLDEIFHYVKDYERRNISFGIFSEHNNIKIFKDVYGFSTPEYNKRSGEHYCMLTSDTASIVFDSRFSGKTRCQLELRLLRNSGKWLLAPFFRVARGQSWLIFLQVQDVFAPLATIASQRGHLSSATDFEDGFF